MGDEQKAARFDGLDSAELRRIASSPDYTDEAREQVREVLESRGEPVDDLEPPPADNRPSGARRGWVRPVLVLISLSIVGVVLVRRAQLRDEQEKSDEVASAIAETVQRAMKPLPLPPLLVAARDCNLTTVKELISKGADPNQRSAGTYYTSALFLAVSTQCEEVAEYLIGQKADVNFSDGTHDGGPGNTALASAVNNHNGRLVRSLLAAGADPNKIAHDETPLQKAITSFPIISNYDPERHNVWANNAIEIIEVLLAAGADPSVKTATGQTLVDLVQTQFDRDYKPSGLELSLKRKQGGRMEGEARARQPRVKPRTMETFYRGKEKQILELLKKHRPARDVGQASGVR